MAVSGILTAILAGIVLGVLGRLLVPGKQAIGWVLTFALGIIGAFGGGFLAEGLGLTVWWHVFIIQAVVAAILVFLVAGLLRSRSSARR